MITLTKILLVIFFLSGATPNPPEPKRRDPAQVRAFRKTHPCPATMKTTGACKGWVVQHLYALCFGGKDTPANMAWQPYADSLKSDVFERAACDMKKKYEVLKRETGK